MNGFILDGKLCESEIPIINGKTLKAWWELGERASNREVCRKRKDPHPTGCVVHHTAGEGDALLVYKILRNRALSVHFFINRAGIVTQFADIADVCLHAGNANEWSWGIEITNPGISRGSKTADAKLIKDGKRREIYTDNIHGKPIHFLSFFPEQREATVKLIRSVHTALGLKMNIPHSEKGAVIRSLVKVDTSKYQIYAHYMLTKSKIDPSPELMDYLFTHI
jgi:hypothetical protein